MQPAASALKLRIAQWAAAAPVLQEVRDADTRSASTATALKNLQGSIHQVAGLIPERKISGLVEQQRWFQKIRLA
jgi:hypothetical protein